MSWEGYAVTVAFLLGLLLLKLVDDLTRRSIAFQLAPTQIGIRNTLSMISSNAKPSMPSAQAKRPKTG